MEQGFEAGSGPNISRRVLLAGFVAAYTASLIPWALGEEVVDADIASFTAVSAILVGRPALDAGLAQRLLTALVATDAGFAAKAKSLLDTIDQRKLDLATLQKTLDDEKSPLATVPRVIVTAWFLGIVGSGDAARCIAFEDALNAQVVADVLKPPTYAYGPYASWTSKPV
jgi:hypothetical protein